MDDSISEDVVTSPILSTILYFDIFDHPLNLSEIYQYCPEEVNQELLPGLLQDMCQSGLLQVSEGYYGVGNMEQMVARRRASEKKAQDMLSLAYENGQFIERFPFVTSVFLSGSISKNVMHEQSDIDYFILAKHGRVWMSMLLLKLYKKIALRKQSEYFCMNYFLSDREMKIAEESMFTAVEIASLLPVSEADLKKSLVEQNPWVKKTLPNHPFLCENSSVQGRSKGLVIRSFESVFSGWIGGRLDQFIRRSIGWVNRIKFRQFKDHPDWELMFRTSPNQAKFHSKNHHRKILNLHQERLASSEISAVTTVDV